MREDLIPQWTGWDTIEVNDIDKWKHSRIKIGKTQSI